VRKLFIPPPGYGVFDTDFDSADLRVVVAESGCREMQSWLDQGLKPYIQVAREYHKDPTIDKYHPAYKLFKAYCHGSNYMGSAAGLAKRIGLLVHESEKLQKWYFGKFPEIHGWHKRIRAQVDGRGYIENCFGYRFVFYDKGRFTLYQQACAWIPQSTVACLVNRAMVSITKYENPEKLRVLLQVHDSLAGLYRLDVDPKAALKKHMEITLPYPGKHIIIPADAALSTKSWGDCG
jgi:DNA polymerase-1